MGAHSFCLQTTTTSMSNFAFAGWMDAAQMYSAAQMDGTVFLDLALMKTIYYFYYLLYIFKQKRKGKEVM